MDRSYGHRSGGFSHRTEMGSAIVDHRVRVPHFLGALAVVAQNHVYQPLSPFASVSLYHTGRYLSIIQKHKMELYNSADAFLHIFSDDVSCSDSLAAASSLVFYDRAEFSTELTGKSLFTRLRGTIRTKRVCAPL